MSLTVILPNYNHGAVIGEQLRAIFAQSVQPETLLVIDDGSTDDSVERIRGLIRGHANAQLICKPRNAGVVAAMNEGLEMAGTEYVAFSAADDVVLPGLYEKSLAMLNRHPDAAFCSTVAYVDNRSRRTVVPKRAAWPCAGSGFVPPARVREVLMHLETWVMGTTLIHRRRCLVEAGGFRAELRSYCDGFAYLVMALRHGACFIAEPLAVWRRDDRGYSSATSRDDEAMEQILKAVSSLMATQFPELFPDELRRRINGRLLFRAMTAKLRAFQARAQLAALAAEPATGVAPLSFIVDRAMRVLELAFFCTLRRHDVAGELRSRISAR